MTTDGALAFIPLASGFWYLGLLALVRRRASGPARLALVYLAWVAAWSFSAFAWRIVDDRTTQNLIRRLLEAEGMTLGAVYLFMIQAFYPSPWARRARIAAFAAIPAVWLITLSGILDKIAIEGQPASPPEYALIAVGMAAWIGSYALALGYTVFTYRHRRDPNERNRLKYAGIAAACILLGTMTNLVPLLRQFPVDHAANLVAGTLVAYSTARYRLFNLDVVVRRSLVRALAMLPSLPLAVGLFWLLFPWARPNLGTFNGVGEALLLMGLIGTISAFTRARIERGVDRLLVGGHVDHREAVVDFTRRTQEMHDVQGITHEVAQLAQLTTDSGCVAVMLVDYEHGHLRLTQMSGPFQRLRPEWTIGASNPLLQAIAQRNEVITPLALDRMIEDGHYHPAEVAEFAPYRTYLAAPITQRGELIGCMFVAPKVYDSAFSLSDLDTLQLIASQAGLSLHSATLFEQLRERAQTDFLTGLPNHRHLQELVAQMLGKAEGTAESFVVAMVDIDNFKMLNDVHGHPVGDDALRRISAAIRDAIRPIDVVGRYGGDEFLLLMPGLDRAQGVEVMTRVSRVVRRLALVAGTEASRERLPARISWGLAAYPEGGITARALITSADSELLQHRFAIRRTGTVHTERPTVRQLMEQDPEKLRIARALLDLIDAKDPYTSEHSQQIASFALLAAQELALPDRERYALWLGSLLHDVGKIGTPAWVLRKPGRLSPDEWDHMRQHPVLGEQMVRGLFDMPEVVEIVGSHHERWDGSGYPRGLEGEDIPRLARVVSVADAFSAMVHDRPYRKGLTWDAAAEELRRAAGTQLDPAMVEAFIRAMGHDEDRKLRESAA